MENSNDEFTIKERERRKIHLQRTKARKRDKRMRALDVIRMVAWISLIGGGLYYHYLCLGGLTKFTIAGDFNNLIPQSLGLNQTVDSITKMMSSFVDPVFANKSSLNVTHAFELVLNNQTEIQPLLDYMNTPSLTMPQFWNTLQNSTTPREILDNLYEAFWRVELPLIFPPEFYQPQYFFVGYNGSIPITNILVYIDLSSEGTVRVLSNVENQLTGGQNLTISLTIGDFLQALVQVSYHALVNATYNAILVGGTYFYEYIGEYLQAALNSIQLFGSFGLQASVGLIPANVTASVDLTPIIQNFIRSAV